MPYFFRRSTACVLVLGTLVGVVGCSSVTDEAMPANCLAASNFDALAGWGGLTNPALTQEQAYSGRFSTKIDSTVEYSVGYQAPLGSNAVKGSAKITVEAWAWRKSYGADAKLVLQITDPAANGKQLFWQAIDVSRHARTARKWAKVSQEFVLPPGLLPTQQFWFFMWRQGNGNPVYLDDVRIMRHD